jgi:hypothetical protein
MGDRAGVAEVWASGGAGDAGLDVGGAIRGVAGGVMRGLTGVVDGAVGGVPDVGDLGETIDGGADGAVEVGAAAATAGVIGVARAGVAGLGGSEGGLGIAAAARGAVSGPPGSVGGADNGADTDRGCVPGPAAGGRGDPMNGRGPAAGAGRVVGCADGGTTGIRRPGVTVGGILATDSRALAGGATIAETAGEDICLALDVADTPTVVAPPKSSATVSAGPISITLEQTEQRARTPGPGTFAGSMR